MVSFWLCTGQFCKEEIHIVDMYLPFASLHAQNETDGLWKFSIDFNYYAKQYVNITFFTIIGKVYI